MSLPRLSALDASFLEVEGPEAHMHVGWASRLQRPADGRPSDFSALRDHIAGRLGRAPRWRQRLEGDPLAVADPVWVDDPDFDVDRHILHATGSDLGEVVDAVMSVPLTRSGPLWELWIADALADGTIGLVGKAHHCMVDGVAAVEMGSMLLDPGPEPVADERDGPWTAEPSPGSLGLTALALADGARGGLAVARSAAGLLRAPHRAVPRSPRRALDAPVQVARRVGSLAGALLPVAARSPLNRPGSPLRHLAWVRWPLDDLRAIKRAHGTTVNDVVLAACAGALRRWALRHGEPVQRLKTMVPVDVRSGQEGGAGNQISFLFVPLPCDVADPLGRLAAVHAQTARRKATGEATGTDAVVDALGLLPRPVRRVAAHAFASPRMFNLVISNIPGPPGRLYLDGCELCEAYPIVPLAGEHALSIGMTTVQGHACFGLYADRKALPDADHLARDLEAELEELATLV